MTLPHPAQLWTEQRKRSRHPCDLCPLVKHLDVDCSLARSHPPGNYIGGARQSQRRAFSVFMERLPDLASRRVIRPPSAGRAASVCRIQLRSSNSKRRGCLWNWGLAGILSSLPPSPTPPGPAT